MIEIISTLKLLESDGLILLTKKADGNSKDYVAVNSVHHIAPCIHTNEEDDQVSTDRTNQNEEDDRGPQYEWLLCR